MAVGRLAILLIWWLAAATAWAAVQPDGLTHERRRWTQADGAPQQSFRMTQTNDGLLWFSSPAGLYSFDGVRFRQETRVFGHALMSSGVASVLALPDGALAVGYHYGGLSIFSRGGVRHFAAGKDFPSGSTMSLSLDAQGVLHAATTSALVRLRDGKWERIGQGSLPTGLLTAIVFDRDGALWASVNAKYYARAKGSDRFVEVLDADDQWLTTVGGVVHTVLRDRGLVRLRLGAPIEPVRMERPPTPVAPQLYANGMFDGPDGSIWYQRSDGVARMVPGADGILHAAEVFPVGGNGDSPHAGMVDREGNMWLISFEGVERYRPHRFRRVPTSSESFYWMAQRGFDDELWMGSMESPMVRLRADGGQRKTAVVSPQALVRVAPDHVWVGTSTDLWEFHGDAQRHWPLPPELGKGFDVQSMTVDRTGQLLVAILRNGLWRFEQGKWRHDERLRAVPDPTPLSMLTDSAGRTWLGLVNNRFGELTSEGFRPVALDVGTPLAMLDSGGRLLVGGERGVAWLEKSKDKDTARPMRLARGEAIHRVTGLAIDGQGALWIHSDDGLRRVDAAALQRFWHAPDRPVEAELFNFEDGVRGLPSQVRPLPSLTVAHGGRLYYATVAQVGWIGTEQIRRNTRPPGVLIQSLHSAGHDYDPADGVALPERTTTVDIAFTATALSVPERVRLKYRLDGVDADWREIRHERSAQYTNLAPGSYVFHAIAANEDGVWNETGSQLRFTIDAAFWQTWWFRLGCAAVLLLALALLYRWRIAVVRGRAEARTAARLDATLQERNRIARALHDNLLQAVQALILRFYAVQTKLPQEPELQAMLDKVLSYAEKLVEHARDEVLALRQAPPCEELIAELRGALAKAVPDAEHLLEFVVSGAERQLRNDTAVEILYVLREAVLNSARHARATRIAVRLRFEGEALHGEVSDNGVGIPADIARTGRPGHWGLVGMRERIGRVGGTLAIAAGSDGGTVVSFSVSAAAAYAQPA